MFCDENMGSTEGNAARVRQGATIERTGRYVSEEQRRMTRATVAECAKGLGTEH